MKLIRENKEKHRATYFCEDRYRKVWSRSFPEWIEDHVRLLNIYVPNYVLAFGENWIEYKIIPGVSANKFTHTPEFVNKIYTFCLSNIKQTAPYVHGDWSLSNIIIDGDNMTMCDWDNLGIYPTEEVHAKLISDLTNAFGEKMVQQGMLL